MEYKPSDTLSDAGAQSALETRLPAMLTRLADGMPASVGLADRVERQLTTNTDAIPHTARWRWGGVFGAPAARQRAVSAVGLMVVVALIAGFAVALYRQQSTGRQPGGSPNGQSGVCGPHGTLISSFCHLHGASVSIEVMDAYADTVRASVELRVKVTHAQIPHGSPTTYSAPVAVAAVGSTLTYAPGHTEGELAGYGSGTVSTGADKEVFIFQPLPASLGGAQRTLTLTITQVMLSDSHGHSALIDGPWNVPVTVTPQPTHTITFHVAPITHQGITVRPVQLNVAPAVSVFDGLQGGEQLILRVSGLPTTMKLSDLVAFSLNMRFANGGGASSTPSGGGRLTLENQQPGMIDVAGYDVYGQDSAQEVGPSGAATLEVSFTGPALATLTGMQPLVIDEFGVNGSSPVFVGPWTFQLPLN
ncbi:MAG TPA: hypothetical protein VMV29_23570 [Ktedonobacterales bacterium]|nr:hypothetical protein [Ktedonobacterales bacterium]